MNMKIILLPVKANHDTLQLKKQTIFFYAFCVSAQVSTPQDKNIVVHFRSTVCGQIQSVHLHFLHFQIKADKT